MTDNELFNHFKTQSIAFNEMPSDALWARIESELDNPKPTGKPHTLLFIICGIAILAGIAFYTTLPKDKTITSPATPTVIKQHVIVPTKPSGSIIEPSTFTVIPGKSISKKNTETINTPITRPENKTDSVKKIAIRTAKVTVVTSTPTVKPTINFMTRTNGTLTQPQPSLTFEVIKKETFGNIIIITKEKITKHEYLQLIMDMLNEYEKYPGAILTIKAPGHKPFKKVMGLDEKLTVGLKLDDSIFKKSSTTPVLQSEKPELKIIKKNPKTISFGTSLPTNDSLPGKGEKLSN